MLVQLEFVRPWYTTWGSSEQEQRGLLPGDEVRLTGPRETRAIAIASPAENVFSWVAQLGQDRGGFYSYELLEDLAGCEMPNVQELDPSLQRWSIGDRLWMYPPRKLNGLGHATLLAHEPGRALVFGTHTPLDAPESLPSGTWSFVVQPTSPTSSRLIVRGRGTSPPSLLGVAFTQTLFEPLHFAMERRMLEGIRGLAEGRPISRLTDTLMLVLWTLAFVTFVAAGVFVLLGARWRRRVVGFVLAGAAFEILTLGQTSLWLGIPLVVSLLLFTWAPRRPRLAPRELLRQPS